MNYTSNMKYCILSGAELNGAMTIAKKMCLNCQCLVEDNGVYRCNNEEVKNLHSAKIIESLPEGYEIESLVFKPVIVKDPTKKCGRHSVNMALINAAIAEIQGVFK